MGLREYGVLASAYVRQFEEKWLDPRKPPEEPLVGTADLQSLADLAGSYDIVRSMRLVPLGRNEVLILGRGASPAVPAARVDPDGL